MAYSFKEDQTINILNNIGYIKEQIKRLKKELAGVKLFLDKGCSNRTFILLMREFKTNKGYTLSSNKLIRRVEKRLNEK